MGFFSWKCAKTKRSIPAFPYAEMPEEYSRVVMVLPNKVIRGTYDGYGRIDGVDVYDEIAKVYFKDDTLTREAIFNHKKYITAPDGTKSVIDMFHWEKEFEFEGRMVNLNQLRNEGYVVEQDFYLSQNLIKIVAENKYNGESFDELPPSEDCPNQGFFYDDDDMDEIKQQY